MSEKMRRTLAAVLCLVMALGLLLPAGAALAEEDDAVAEIPVDDAAAEEVAVDVGTMPDVFDDDESATLWASAPVQKWTVNDTSNTFFTVDCVIQPETEGGTCYPANFDGVQYDKNAKLEKGKDVKFTIPEGQSGTFSMVIKSRASKAGDATFGLDGTTVSLGTTSVTLYTNATLTAGTHTISCVNKQADIYLLMWEPAHTHDWGAGVVTKAATCTAKGVRTYTCADCGQTKTEDVDMIAHTEKTVARKEPTCVAEGKTAEVVCGVCNAHISGGEVIPATKEHKLDASFKCTVCGKQLADPAHTCVWAATGTVLKAATCTQDGSEEFACTVANCDKTDVRVLTKLGHNEVSHAAKAATCTEAGWDAYVTCSRCDYTTQKTIPAKGHTTGADGVCSVCGLLVSKPLTNAGGWFETLYAVLPGVKDAQVTAVSYSGAMNGRLTGEDFQYLVRDTADGVRVDIPGLTAGTYTLRVTAGDVTYEAKDIQVLEYDRSGYAHYQYTDGVGAYRDDGVLKENAIVLYVTEENKNTVTVTSADGTTVTGIGNILNSHGRDVGGGVNSNGGKANSNQDILRKLAKDGTPLVVRFVGSVTSSHPNPTIDGVTAYDSVDYGGSTGDNGNMVRMKGAKDVTIEGIGTDAVMDGWGLHFMCQSSDYPLGFGKSFEVRNLAFRNVPEDCVGMEGIQSGTTLTAPVERCWIHNCSFYAPSISNPAESDKDGGDGACDFKRGQYMTMSYCYYDGYHKTNLVGSSDSSLQYHITWHHNYWKTCDSRGPLGRQANMHIYNCIYDGQTTYAQNVRANCYIFSEYNAFLNCKAPRSFKTGVIKSYNDVLSSCINDATTTVNTVTDKNQKVSSGNKYANFDTDPTLSYIPSGDYKLDQDHAVARANVLAYAGPMKTQIIAPEDIDSSTVAQERIPTAAVVLPYDQAINNSYITASGVKDNILFTITSANGTAVKYGKDSVGQYVVFKVDEPVDVTMDGAASVLVNANGDTVAEVPGSATNLPAGIYYIQSSSIQPAKGTTPMYYKDGSLSHLTIKAAANYVPPHVHTYAATGTVSRAATCTLEGVMLYKCTANDDGYRTEPIAKLDHNYVGGACTMCGVTEGTFGGDPDAPVVAVEDLTLDVTEISVLQNKTERVIATVIPSNATDKLVTWESADPDIATVAKNGTITGKGPGATTVTATAGGITRTVQVYVIAVTTNTYTFSAEKEGPKAMSADEPAVADNSKWGTESYFTNNGSGNKWKAVNFKGGKKDTGSLLLAGQQGSSFDFAVSAGATASVTLNFTSTSSSNTSAIAILDASGNMVQEMAIVEGTGAKSATYELSAGTYKIVAPKDVQPDDVNDSWDAFPTDANNPNKRGVRLISVSVVEETVASGDYVAVSGVTLDQTAATVEVGQSLTLAATVAPANATNKSVSWATSDASVATVSSGVVTARGVGTATITATAGGRTATCAVTVTPSTHEAVKVTSITVTDAQGKTSGAVTADGKQAQELQLTQTVQPEDADNMAVTWSSDCVNKGVSVSSTGLVTVSDEAESCVATITATAKDGSGVKGSYTLTVTGVPAEPDEPGDDTVAVTGVKLSQSVGGVTAGKTLVLTATVQPSNATNKGVYWTSSDTKIVTVSDKGLVTGVAVGTANVTVTTLDGNFTATCAITVSAASSGGSSSSGGGGGGSSSGGGGGSAGGTTPPATTMPFVDVPDNVWYVDSVRTIYALGLMKGTDDTHFAPSATTTRAMVATVLYRLDGEKDANVASLFGDVVSGSWYEAAVKWAADKGVVKGYSESVFAPDDNVTREQLAVMLYRYANGETATVDLSAKFSDAASVSDWAADAIAWAVDKGILNGKGDGTLDPQGLATRAEICAMLVRFVNLDK